MQISLWGGREPTPEERFDFFGYGPLIRRPENVTEAEHRANQRLALLIVGASGVGFLAVAIVVGTMTHSDVAVFFAVLVIPIGLLMIATLGIAAHTYVRYSQRNRRAAATPPATDQTSSVIQS